MCGVGLKSWVIRGAIPNLKLCMPPKEDVCMCPWRLHQCARSSCLRLDPVLKCFQDLPWRQPRSICLSDVPTDADCFRHTANSSASLLTPISGSMLRTICRMQPIWRVSSLTLAWTPSPLPPWGVSRAPSFLVVLGCVWDCLRPYEVDTDVLECFESSTLTSQEP